MHIAYVHHSQPAGYRLSAQTNINCSKTKIFFFGAATSEQGNQGFFFTFSTMMMSLQNNGKEIDERMVKAVQVSSRCNELDCLCGRRKELPHRDNIASNGVSRQPQTTYPATWETKKRPASNRLLIWHSHLQLLKCKKKTFSSLCTQPVNTYISVNWTLIGQMVLRSCAKKKGNNAERETMQSAKGK